MRTFSTAPHSLKNSVRSSSVADQARFLMKMVALPCAALVSTLGASATLAFFAGGAFCPNNSTSAFWAVAALTLAAAPYLTQKGCSRKLLQGAFCRSKRPGEHTHVRPRQLFSMLDSMHMAQLHILY